MIADAAQRLLTLGWRLDVDFIAYGVSPTETTIQWLSASPMPSAAEIDAVDMSPAAQTAREDAQEPLLADLKSQAQAAIDANNVFLAIATPSNAQNAAQAKALTQQNNRIIKALARLVVRAWR